MNIRGKIEKTPFSTIGYLIQNGIPIFTMKDTNEMYIYKNGVYKNEGSRSFLDRKIRDSCAISGQNATRNFVEEVLAYIRAYTYVDRNEVDQGHYINFKNGMFNLETGDLEEHSPNHKSIRQIPVEYDPEAKCPTIEKFLSDVVVPENIPLIYEWIGLSLIPDTRFGKALMLYGTGSNGKTVFLNLFMEFLGLENIAHEGLQKLENDKYSVANLYGKLMNICPDLPSTKMHEQDTFKQLTGNDSYIRGERKYQNAFSFKNTARLTFSANELPKGNIDYSFSRRWILIQFPNTFEGDKKDQNLIDKLVPELSGLLNLALAGLKRLQKGNFSNSKTVDETQREYLVNSNLVGMFLDECTIPSERNTDYTKMYAAYEKWASENNINVLEKNTFCKKMKNYKIKTYRRNSFNNELGHFVKIPQFVEITLI